MKFNRFPHHHPYNKKQKGRTKLGREENAQTGIKFIRLECLHGQ